MSNGWASQYVYARGGQRRECSLRPVGEGRLFLPAGTLLHLNSDWCSSHMTMLHHNIEKKMKDPLIPISYLANVEIGAQKLQIFRMKLFLMMKSVFIVQLLSHVRIFVTPWTVACQAPLSMEFSRQEYWSGLPFSFSRRSS